MLCAAQIRGEEPVFAKSINNWGIEDRWFGQNHAYTKESVVFGVRVNFSLEDKVDDERIDQGDREHEHAGPPE
jgi:hypothetical protein